MRFYLLCILFFFTSCSYFQKGSITVKVESKHKTIADNEISLYSLDSNENKEIKVIESHTNKSGVVKWNVDFSKLQVMKVIVRNKNIENIYLPEVLFLTAPKWWQDRELNIVVTLKEINFQKHHLTQKFNKEKSREFDNILDFPIEPINHMQSIAQIEENLPPEKMIEQNISMFLNEKNKTETLNSLENSFLKSSTTLNTITEKKSVLFEDTITLEVINNNKPIENALIFLGRNGTQAVRYLGTSDSMGSLSFNALHQYRPDIVIVKKDNFITTYKPLATGSGKQNFKIEMVEGKSSDFILQNYAYFVGRGLDKTELKLNSLKLDVSSLLGFVSAQKQIDDKSFLTLAQKNAIPEVIDFRTLKKAVEISNLSNQLPILYVSSLLPYKPAVGFVEPPVLGAIQNNPVWRRARREFFSRFMNEMSLRSIISDDVNKIANAMNLSTLELAKQGWKDSIYSGELDILLQLYFDENENGKDFNLIGKIYDKTGKIIFEKEQIFQSDDAEKISANMYSLMLANIPIEGVILKKNKKEVTINLGKNQNLVETDLFVIYAQKNPNSPPDRPIGIGKVKNISDKESILDIQVGWEQIEKNDVLRCVRYPEKLIQQEIQNHIASF